VALAERAKVVAELDLDTGKFTKGFKNATASMSKFSQSIAKSRAVAVGLGVGLERAAEKGISALGNAIGDGIDAALELEKAQAATAAVIESTGHKAGISAEQVRTMAESLEDVTTASDRTIQQGENLLLTFTNIGKTVFPDATKAMVNMAIAFNKGDAATADFDGAAIQLGKALNDPVTGFTALKRAGVSFNDAQIKILKGTNSLSKEETKHYNQLRKSNKAAAERYKQGVLTNKLIASQKLILGELNTEFGKAGAAAGTGFAADINRANDAIEDAKIAIAQGLIPAVGEVARELSTVLKDPAVINGLKELGKGIGEAIKGIVAFGKTVPWGSIATSLQAAAGFAKDLLNAFLGLPDWVKTAVITGWGLNKLTGGALNDLIGSLATGLIKGVLGINAGVVNLNAANVVGGPGGVPVAGAGAAASEAGTLSSIVASVLGAPGLLAGIAAVGAKAATDAFNAQAGTQLQFPAGFAGIPQSLDFIATGIRLLTDGPINTNDDTTQGDIEALRGTIIGLINQKPTGGGDRGPGTQGDMESRRGAIGDALSAAEIGKQVEQGVGPDIELVRQAVASGLDDTTAGLETVRGTVSTGLNNTSTAARNAGFTAANAAYGAATGIENTIRNNRPIINVDVNISATTVEHTVTVTDRNGPSGGSASDDLRGYPH